MVVNNQNRTQNWFSASKAIFEMENLTEHDIVVYLYLCRCIEKDTYQKYLRELIRFTYVRVNKERCQGRFTTNIFVIVKNPDHYLEFTLEGNIDSTEGDFCVETLI